jgi:PAS domain S-box-containing protein
LVKAESLARLQSTISAIHFLDDQGVIVEVNDAEVEWLRYSQEELIGERLLELLTAESQTIFLESSPQFKVLGFLRDLSIELIGKDGTILPVLVTASASAAQKSFLLSRSV